MKKKERINGKVKAITVNQYAKAEKVLYIAFAVISALLIATMIMSKLQAKDRFWTGYLVQGKKLALYYQYNPAAKAQDQAMQDRQEFPKECWVKHDNTDYLEQSPKSFFRYYRLTGRDCVSAFSRYRNNHFQRWTSDQNANYTIKFDDPQLAGYYADNSSELAWDQMMTSRKGYHGACWVSPNKLIYSEADGYIKGGEKKEGWECLKAFQERRNQLYANWFTAHQNIN